MKPKAILFTAPCKSKNNFWTCSITSPVGSMMPPCDLMSVASVLCADGIETRILDLRIVKNPHEAFLSALEDMKPDAIITNITTAAAQDIYPLLRMAVGLVDKRIVFGFHAMALPNDVFDNGATHILAGDPEYSASAAIKGIGLENGIWTGRNSGKAPGWLSSLDELPFQALDLVDVGVYHSLIMGKEKFSILLANRGCPQQCTYCVIPFLFGHKPRFMSVKRVVDEMEYHASKYGIRSFFFIDSAINLNQQWTVELCEEILRRNLNIRWCSNMRVSPVTEDLLSLMRKSGCFRLFYGVEDLDQLERLHRNTTVDMTRKAFELTRRAEIESVAFIIMFPENDKEVRTMAARIMRMIDSLKPDAIQCNLAVPYPGSKMYAEFMEIYGMPNNWNLFDPAGNELPYPVDLDLVKVRQMVYMRFFMKNPRYVWSIVKSTDFRSLAGFIRNSLKVLTGI